MAGEEGLEVKSFDEIVLMPLKYIDQVKGKGIGIKLQKAFNYWLNIPLDKFSEILDIVRLVFQGFLLVDDIEDGSEKRRGIPCAHHVFGVGRTFNSANYAYFLALEKTSKLGHPDAVKVFTEQLLEAHRGQGMELHWREEFLCPSEKEYKEMVIQKSGALFQMRLKLMQLFSENKTDLTQIIDILGFRFQIVNDYANLMSKEYAEKKGFCEDITEGKFSFPMIHAIRNNPDDSRLMNIIKQRTTDVELKKHALDIMEELGSLEYTRKVLSDLDVQRREEIARLGHNPYLIDVIEEMDGVVI